MNNSDGKVANVLRIAQITDLHLDDFLTEYYQIDSRGNLIAILEDIKRRGISNIVLTGDLGAPKTIPWLFEVLDSLEMHPLVIPGNHDDLGDLESFKFLTADQTGRQLYYSRIINGVCCIFLDSRSNCLDAEQIQWLKRQSVESRDHMVVFVHHPVFDCGNTVMDRLYPLENRAAVQEILIGADREITLFCGHYHAEHSLKIGKIAQYVTPSVIVQLKKAGEKIEIASKDFGYRMIELSPNVVKTETVIM